MISDFNINVINNTNSTRNWLLTTDSLNMTQLVKKPTRVTATSETLIDHVYSNTIDNIIEVTVPVLGVSAHYPVCMVLGHFGHGHFGHGRFGQDISATDISATDISANGHFGHGHFGHGIIHSICFCSYES